MIPKKLEPAQESWAFEAFQKVTRTPWNREEANMARDVTDWAKMDEADRGIVAGILRGFSLIEQSLGSYWRTLPERLVGTPLEGSPEVKAMCGSFSYQECIHAYAYSFLESTLGLDTYEAFTQDQACVDKISLFEENVISDLPIGEQIALFSAFGEGISLYGSFAVLLDITRRGVLTGVQEILSWSVRDELLHFRSGIQLAKRLGAVPNEKICEDYMDRVVICEHRFLDSVGVDHSFHQFVNHRANQAMTELGYPGKYYVEANTSEISEWFYPLVQGTNSNDFFATPKNGSSYTKTTPSFSLNFAGL